MRDGIPSDGPSRRRAVLVAVADPGPQHSRADGEIVGFLSSMALTRRVSRLGAGSIRRRRPDRRRVNRRSSFSMSGSGFVYCAASGSAASASSVRASRISITSPCTRCPAPCRSGLVRSAPSTWRRSTRTLRGSSMRVLSELRGTTAASSSMSPCIPRLIAIRRAVSGDSRTDMSPSWLSSRTTSPLSVIHEVVCRPENVISTRNAGIGRVIMRYTGRPRTLTAPARPSSRLALADFDQRRLIRERGRVEDQPGAPGTGFSLAARVPRKVQAEEGASAVIHLAGLRRW